MSTSISIDRAAAQSLTSNRRVLWLYVVGITIWGMDFRAAGPAQAAAIQGLILALYLGCWLWIISAGARRRIAIGPLWVLMLAVVLFLADTSLVALIKGQARYLVFSGDIPICLYLATAVLTYVTLSILKDNTQGFLDGLRLACIASATLHIGIIMVLRGGINLATSRFEVLSGAAIGSLGVLAVGLAQPWSLLDVLVVLISLTVAVLSVTRTLLITLAVQIFGVIIARPSSMFRRESLRGVALFSLLVLSIVALDFAAGTGLTARWIDRLFLVQRIGTDPSGLMRLAETRFMWDRFTTSTENLLFGNGIAARTSMVGREHFLTEMLIGKDPVVGSMHSTGFGHENFVSVLFVAGLVGGGGLLLIQFVNALQSVALIRKLQRKPSALRQSDVHIGIWGAVIFLGMLTDGFLAGTLGDRDESLWLGVGTGILYWGREITRSGYSPPKPATPTRSVPSSVVSSRYRAS